MRQVEATILSGSWPTSPCRLNNLQPSDRRGGQRRAPTTAATRAAWTPVLVARDRPRVHWRILAAGGKPIRTINRALRRKILYMFRPSGPVAQGIEQQPSKLKVAGSNPAGVATTNTTKTPMTRAFLVIQTVHFLFSHCEQK
jgi:hypothetical protein